MLVIYKELKEQKDGFIITAFFTTKIKKLLDLMMKKMFYI